MGTTGRYPVGRATLALDFEADQRNITKHFAHPLEMPDRGIDLHLDDRDEHRVPVKRDDREDGIGVPGFSGDPVGAHGRSRQTLCEKPYRVISRLIPSRLLANQSQHVTTSLEARPPDRVVPGRVAL
jgi:hypothetical protein